MHAAQHLSDRGSWYAEMIDRISGTSLVHALPDPVFPILRCSGIKAVSAVPAVKLRKWRSRKAHRP